MGFIVENTAVFRKSVTGVGVAVGAISLLAAQDDIVIAVIQSATTVTGAPAGWEEIARNSGRTSIFFKRQGVTPDTTVSIPTASTNHLVTTFIGRGYDVSTATSAYQAASYATTLSATSALIASPSVTPSNANSSIIHGGCETSGQPVVPADYGAKLIGGWHDGYGLTLVESFQKAASVAAPAYGWQRSHYNFTAIDNCFSFALVDAADGDVKAFVDWDTNPAATPVHFMGFNGHGGENTATRQHNPTGYIADIADGNGTRVATVYDAPVAYVNVMQGGVYGTRVNTTTNGPSIAGSIVNAIPSMVGKHLCFSAKYRHIAGPAPYNDIGAYFGLSDGVNTRLWMTGGADTLPLVKESVSPVIIDPDGGFEWEDFGTVTLANCDTLVWGFNHPSTDNEDVYMSPVTLLEPLILEGGTSKTPANMDDLRQIVQLNRLNTWVNQAGASKSQYLGYQSVELRCDYWNGSGQSRGMPRAYDEVGGYVQAMIADGSLDFLINVEDGATFIDRNNVVDQGSYHAYGWKHGTSTDPSTVYDVAGQTWLHCTPYLNATSRDNAGLLIADSKQAVFTVLGDCSGGMTFSGCVDPVQIAISTQAELTLLAGSSWDNCDRCIQLNGDQTGVLNAPAGMTFDGSVNYAISYTGDTDFTLQVPGSTTGLTVESTGDGTCTLAASGTLTITNVIVGTELRLHVDDGDVTDGFGALIDGVESAASASVVLNYTTGGGSVNALLWHHLPGKVSTRVPGIVLDGSDQTLPIQQRNDRAYKNT